MVKKFLSIVAAVIVGLCTFCGCNNGDIPDNDDIPDPVEDDIPDYVECNHSEGTLYTLSEAYESGCITKRDLQKIADIYNDCETLDISSIDQEIADRMKQARANYYIEHGRKDIIMDWIRIACFYGLYHDDHYVVLITDYYAMYPAVVVDRWEEIGGVAFHRRSFWKIEVWKN